MIPFLEREHEGHDSASLESIKPARIALTHVFVGQCAPGKFCQLKVDVGTGKIVENVYLKGRHSYIDANDMKAAEDAVMADPRVQQRLKDMDLPENAHVVVEPWSYATDDMNDMSKKITMCYFHIRISEHRDSNHFGYPLDLCVEIDEFKNIGKIFYLPSGGSQHITEQGKPYDRRKTQHSAEYHPDLGPPRRTTTKPYQVLQPEGPSFETKGHQISWEKWTMRVGFNYREGLTLHDVRFENRSLFYRLALSEMFVPYCDPRMPYWRKAAFDLGSNGAGVTANNLQLGCDCLGHIKYFDWWHVTNGGEPLKMPNVVCCHEIDDGILVCCNVLFIYICPPCYCRLLVLLHF